ncbi:MAG: response regulator transcription factor [Paludibacteraceae bacterium]|nr:response regulator transcription factor [Paludibacteraceae bacterium]
MQKTKIIVCDGDLSLATVLVDYLCSRGYAAEHVAVGKELVSTLESGHYDLVLLDVQQEGVNGFQLLRDVRRAYPLLAVIVLTGKNDRESQIRAFELGCDDYQLKPFTMDILICRIEAILRRVRTQEENRQRVFELGGKVFDSVHQTFDGEHISGRMSDVLLLLCRRQGSVVDKHFILSEVWNADNAFAGRSLCVYINHLRNMLHPCGYKILAVRGRGYKMVEC